MTRIYVVTLNWQTVPVLEDFDQHLAVIGDWVRWNNSTWFLSTTLSSIQIREFIMNKIPGENQLVVAELSRSGLEGWAPKWVWDWFNHRWALDANPPSAPSMKTLF